MAIKKQFDTRVHIRSPKTGKVASTQPYRLHVSKDKGAVFERGERNFAPNGADLGPAKKEAK